MRLLALTVAAGTALTGCAAQGPVVSSFNREAGLPTEQAAFGSAVAANAAINNGDETYRVNLARRFAAEVQTMVNFPFNSYALDDQARAILRQQANFINQFPEVRFKVYGHTDLVGSTAYNRALGLRRAEAVVLYLGTLGVDRSRVEAVVSFGETQPLIVTEGQERANRRTVTEVSGFVGRHPTVLNGRYAEIIFREYVELATAPRATEGITGDDFAVTN